MGLLLLFAYRGIKSILVTSEKADLEKFKSDFANLIDEMSAYGRGRVDTVKTPAGFGKLCLIDQSKQGATNVPLVDQSVSAGSDNNVYLISVDGTKVEAFKADPMQIGTGQSACLDISLGKVKLNLEGKTKFTVVKEVQAS